MIHEQAESLSIRLFDLYDSNSTINITIRALTCYNCYKAVHPGLLTSNFINNDDDQRILSSNFTSIDFHQVDAHPKF